MKKISFILMALAMVMGMTQCKKEQNVNGNNDPELVGEKYEISLNLGGGSNAKAGVYPFENDPTNGNYAPVYYEQDDHIEVIYKGIRVGRLTCTSATQITDANAATAWNTASATFSGGITIPDGMTVDETSPLYFCFLGESSNVTISDDYSKLTVDLSDQTASLPVISYAASKEPFAASTTTYHIYNGYNATGSNWLLNQCALVRFTCENIYDQSTNANDNNPDAIYTTTNAITIYGMKNQVEVTFNESGVPQFAWNEVGQGGVTLYLPSAPSGETDEQAAARIATRYAIVQPGNYSKVDELLDVAYTPSTYQSHNDEYGFYGTYKLGGTTESPVTIANNQYYPDGEIDLVWHSGAFSINSSGTQVVFSRGNLQYAHKALGARQAQTWRFAKHQFDWVGGELERNSQNYQGNVVKDENTAESTEKSDNTQVGDGNYYGWIDLFGYGTTAHNPTLHTKLNSDYIKNDGTVISPSWHFEDWGENNIVNSGTPNNTEWWTSLTVDESKYLFEDRADADDKLGFAEITLNDGFGNEKVRGLVVLPDYWDNSWNIGTWYKAQWDASQTNLSWPSNHTNKYDKDEWKTMESHGAVFLPCAGYRDTDGTNNSIIEYDGGLDPYQNRGTYWVHGVQTVLGITESAYGLSFGYASGADLSNHVQGNTGLIPDNGRSVRLVHRL